ncbi:MAG: hypothetical protein LBP95_13070 [Deltaproteobacteria bacterium]|jgi:hypothetical protein|nr:hypothetical protein [Deltaproteobacteria bacterium]
MHSLANILESLMLVSFGLAWPANIMNTLRVKSSRSRTPVFLIIVETGYVFGLSAKFASGNVNYVAFFYVLNMAMVGFDLFLYYRYLAKDKLADKLPEQED